MNARILRLARGIYALMLRAYPADFRREYRREMLLVFERRARDVVEDGGAWALLPFMAQIAWDWLRTFVRERKDAARPCQLGLDGDGAACTVPDADAPTRSVSLMLAVLGMFLLIFGWYQWVALMSVRR